MNKFISLLSAIFIGFIAFFAFSVRIEPAEVGILVDMYGSDKGVELEVIGTGRTFYNSITHDVITYPAYIQQGVYEDVKFQDIDGLTLDVDIAIDYKFVPENIPALYMEYRKSARDITRNYFPIWIKNAMVEQSATMQVDKIYGEDKEEFRQNVLAQLREEFETKGIYIDNIYFAREIGIPSEVRSRISDKIEATQIAQQKQNELAAVVAEANKRIAEEEGKAKSRIIESDSRAEANRILNASLSPQILRFKELELQKDSIDKWNGVLPYVTSDSGLILDLGTLK